MTEQPTTTGFLLCTQLVESAAVLLILTRSNPGKIRLDTFVLVVAR
jgi:hypothetical protein